MQLSHSKLNHAIRNRLLGLEKSSYCFEPVTDIDWKPHHRQGVSLVDTGKPIVASYKLGEDYCYIPVMQVQNITVTSVI